MLVLFEELALSGGKKIMRVFHEGCAVENKADASPVTIADRECEAVILAGLRAAYPDIACVAEEECAAGIVPVDLGNAFFLIDPLDGTKEFIKRRTDFTVNIALIRDGEPQVGIVYAPCTGQLYIGRPGKAEAARVDENGRIIERRAIAVRRKPSPATVVASRSHNTPETDAYIASLGGANIVSVGSSLKFCLVAAGEADIYPRFGRTMEWDTAAGDAVLRAAGGRTSTLEGTPLAYGKRNQQGDCDFANPHFVADGDLQR